MGMLITGIRELVTNDPQWSDPPAEGERDDRTPPLPPDVARLGIIRDAALIVGADEPGAPTTVQWVGRAADAPAADWSMDLDGRAVIPGFVDSHSHIVFAGDRAEEFAARMTGAAYDGGGIASTMAATRGADDAELRRLGADRLREMRAQGTTTRWYSSGVKARD